MSDERLPPMAARLAHDYPNVWEAYNSLGEAVAQAGPLDAKTIRLVKLALAIGDRLEGAVHSHVRRGLAEGLTADELRHVALLAVTTLGWPSAVAGFSWVEDILAQSG